jgi:hypothetical protein
MFRDFLILWQMHFKLRATSKPFMVEIAWRIDAIAAWLLNRKKTNTGHSSCFLLDK